MLVYSTFIDAYTLSLLLCELVTITHSGVPKTSPCALVTSRHVSLRLMIDILAPAKACEDPGKIPVLLSVPRQSEQC